MQQLSSSRVMAAQRPQAVSDGRTDAFQRAATFLAEKPERRGLRAGAASQLATGADQSESSLQAGLIRGTGEPELPSKPDQCSTSGAFETAEADEARTAIQERAHA
jgi:hypothetical protein